MEVEHTSDNVSVAVKRDRKKKASRWRVMKSERREEIDRWSEMG